MKTKEEIIEFIKNSCFYKPLCNNLFIQKCISFEQAVRMHSYKRSAFHGAEFVSSCFHWAGTIEGYPYWSKVCDVLTEYENSSN